MLKRNDSFAKSKVLENLSSVKKPGSPSSFYSGSNNAQRILQKPGSWFGRSNTQARFLGGHITTEECRTPERKVEYHEWNSEYSQICKREQLKRSMCKDPYRRVSVQRMKAQENVVTKEECNPELISAKAVLIEAPTIFEQPKVALKSVVRYLRNNDSLPPQQTIRESPRVKSPELPEVHRDSPLVLPPIVTHKKNHTLPTLTPAERLLYRAKISSEATLIRRPPRKLIMNVTRETIVPLSVYA